jgi:outer membrane PBP1 activator LpoA protein
MHRIPVSLACFLALLYLPAARLAIGQAADPLQVSPSIAGPHLAVLLPIKSSTVGRLADAVRRGVLEAHRVHAGNGMPVIVIATDEDPFDITRTYEQAVQRGARMIIGPLTRSAVSALAGSNLVTVPTIALNAPEVDVPLPTNLYLFGIQVENEARQIARIASRQGRRRPLVVISDSPLSRRLSEAFIEEWARLGNPPAERFAYTTDVDSLTEVRDTLAVGSSDMVFLALDARRAKLIRSYLGLSMPVYATSLVHTSSAPLANYELNGVYFVDMPWLLLPDHPAVLIYERPDPAQTGVEFQRFYALGIDAYRMAQALLKPYPDSQPVDGVTGYISIEPDQRLTREAIPAQFVGGDTRVLSSTEIQ